MKIRTMPTAYAQIPSSSWSAAGCPPIPISPVNPRSPVWRTPSTIRPCYRLSRVLLACYLQERGRAGPPERILIDADSTDDPTHGDQEGSAYHGFYEQHMLHPLLLTDGDTDEPIAAILRPGTCHASRGSWQCSSGWCVPSAPAGRMS